MAEGPCSALEASGLHPLPPLPRLHFLTSLCHFFFFFTVISQLCFHHTWGRSCFSQGLLVAKLLSPVTHFLPSTLHYLLNLLPTTPKHPLLTLLYVSTTPLPAPPTKLCSDTHAHSLAIPHPRYVSWEQAHLPTLSMHHSLVCQLLQRTSWCPPQLRCQDLLPCVHRTQACTQAP